MSKKDHPLEHVKNIFSTLQSEAPPPSPAPAPAVQKPMPAPPVVSTKAPKGRPATGKKSDGDYCQTTISIRKATRKRVKQALLDDENGQDVSDLVEQLLSEWLNSRS